MQESDEFTPPSASLSIFSHVACPLAGQHSEHYVAVYRPTPLQCSCALSSKVFLTAADGPCAASEAKCAAVVTPYSHVQQNSTGLWQHHCKISFFVIISVQKIIIMMIFVVEIPFAKRLLFFIALQVPRPSGITVLFGAVTGFIIVSGRMVGLIGLCNACRGVLGAGGSRLGWAWPCLPAGPSGRVLTICCPRPAMLNAPDRPWATVNRWNGA